MNFYEMPCGCKFEVLDDKVKDNDGLPSLKFDFYKIQNCSGVWELLSRGDTKGVFQLESQLGQEWSEKLKPKNIDEIAMLTSIIRPGTLEGEIDGVSMTQCFVDRKHGRRESIPPHPAMKNILEETYNIGCFQEQSIQIVKDVAGFSEGEAELMRKAIGKKDVKKMAELKPKFIQGCINNGLNKEDGEEIFSIIQSSERYSFNRSHATIYSYLTYITAYIKYHFPELFFTAWLHLSKEKIDPKAERKDLINDAKRFNVNIFPPTLEFLSKGFGTEFFNKGKNIYFGLIDIKEIGYKNISSLIKSIKELELRYKKNVSKVRWFDFLCNIGIDINKSVLNNLILVGCIPGSESRKTKIVEYKMYKTLNDKEQLWLKNNCDKFNSLLEALKTYINISRNDGGPYNIKSKEKIELIIKSLSSNSYNLNDDPSWISVNETNLMGVSLSSHILEDYDNLGDTSCKELYDGKGSGNVSCVISEVKTTVTKKGKNPGQEMCFLKIEDQTAVIDAVCFPDIYKKNKDLIFEGSVVIIGLKRSSGKSMQVTSLTRS